MKPTAAAPETPSKLAQTQQSLVSAWDDRNRIFNAMRSPNLSDEQRTELATAYKAASKQFEIARADNLKI